MHVLRKFLPYLKPYRRLLAVALVANAIFSFLSAATIWIILPIMQLVLPSGESPVVPGVPGSPGGGGFFDGIEEGMKAITTDLVVVAGDPVASLRNLCLLVVALFLVKNLVKYTGNVTYTSIEEGVMRDVRNRLFGHTMRLPLGFFSRERSGDLISVVTNEVTVLNTAVTPMLAKLIREPLQVIFLLLFLLALSPKLTLIAFSTSIFTVFFVRTLTRFIKRYSVRMQQSLASLTGRMQESFQNIRIVKAYAAERHEQKRFGDETAWYVRNAIKYSRVVNLNGPVSEMFSITALVVVLFYGGYEVLAGRMQAEELIAFLFLLFSIMTPVVALFQIPSTIQRGVVAGERILALLDEPVELSYGNVVTDGLHDRLALRNVSFSYREGKRVIDNVSLEIRRGETVALVGESGSGKSTLVDLLFRFYDPDEGEIVLDGRSIRDFTFESYRSLFGFVTQESLLFNDTVRANIAYNVADASDAKIEEAARIAHAHDFITRMPQGYDTVIGDRGNRLSGGQRQRIAIARAVLRDPAILLFDEATSALDTESESAVQKAVEEMLRDRTAVIIAHRLSTIRNADRIVVIEDGRIVEQGTHDELLAAGGRYRVLYDAQFRKGESEGAKEE